MECVPGQIPGKLGRRVADCRFCYRGHQGRGVTTGEMPRSALSRMELALPRASQPALLTESRETPARTDDTRMRALYNVVFDPPTGRLRFLLKCIAVLTSV